MEYKLANLISKVFNPFVIVLIFLIFTLNLRFHFSTSIPENARWMILGLAAITTFIIPSLLSNILKTVLKNKMSLEGKDSRLLPLAVTALFYLFTYHLFDRINLSPIFNLFILGMASLAVISMLIIIFRNISVTMVAIGALAGALVGIHLMLHVNLIFYILLAFLFGGLSGFSCLKLERHNPVDIYTGYFTGMLIMLAHYLYF